MNSVITLEHIFGHPSQQRILKMEQHMQRHGSAMLKSTIRMEKIIMPHMKMHS